MAAVYGPCMSVGIFGALIVNGFELALRTALVTLLVASIGTGLGLIPFTDARDTGGRKRWRGRGGRVHGLAAGTLVTVSVLLALVSTTAAAAVALTFVLVVGLALYVPPRLVRRR